MKINRLHLGCGRNYRDGWVNVDNCPDVKADVVHDLNRVPWPFEDDSVSEIEMYGVLEHLDNTIQSLAEIHRILIPGGTAHIHVPYAGSHWAFMDPTHKSYFTERTLDYLKSGFDYNFYTKIRFEIVQAKLTVGWNSPSAILRNLIPFRKVLRWFLWNCYDGVDYLIRKPVG